MELKMKILKIQVVLCDGADQISIFTDLPSPFTEEIQGLCLHFEATKNTGIKYVEKVFSIKPKIINFRFSKEKFSE